jgi:hypothetical protein
VRSRPTKILSAKAALFVLLTFQLIVGLPLQTALAALDTSAMLQAKTIAGARSFAPAAMPATPMPAAANADCPLHDAAHGTAPATSGNKHAPTGNHDCCHVSACQCQCVHTPAVFDLPAFADVATSVALPPFSSAQFVAPRIDEFLRPPIA